MPVVATDTGGIPQIVAKGVSGELLSLDATGDDFADCIAAICRDRDRFARMREAGHQQFIQRLNWTTWAEKTVSIMESL